MQATSATARHFFTGTTILSGTLSIHSCHALQLSLAPERTSLATHHATSLSLTLSLVALSLVALSLVVVSEEQPTVKVKRPNTTNNASSFFTDDPSFRQTSKRMFSSTSSASRWHTR